MGNEWGGKGGNNLQGVHVQTARGDAADRGTRSVEVKTSVEIVGGRDKRMWFSVNRELLRLLFHFKPVLLCHSGWGFRRGSKSVEGGSISHKDSSPLKTGSCCGSDVKTADVSSEPPSEGVCRAIGCGMLTWPKK